VCGAAGTRLMIPKIADLPGDTDDLKQLLQRAETTLA
jgi:hypothetical protein